MMQQPGIIWASFIAEPLEGVVSDLPVPEDEMIIPLFAIGSPLDLSPETALDLLDRASVDSEPFEIKIESLRPFYDESESFVYLEAVLKSDHLVELSSSTAQIFSSEGFGVENVPSSFGFPVSWAEGLPAEDVNSLIDMRLTVRSIGVMADEKPVTLDLDSKSDDLYFVTSDHKSCEGYAVVQSEDNVALSCHDTEIEAQEAIDSLVEQEAIDGNSDLIRYEPTGEVILKTFSDLKNLIFNFEQAQAEDDTENDAYDFSKSSMVALRPSNSEEMSVTGGTEVSEMHLTLRYLGKEEIPFAKMDAATEAIDQAVTSQVSPFAVGMDWTIRHFGSQDVIDRGDVAVVATWEHDDETYALHQIQSAVASVLDELGLEDMSSFKDESWKPHITLGYFAKDFAEEEFPEGSAWGVTPTFDAITIHHGNDITVLDFSQDMSVDGSEFGTSGAVKTKPTETMANAAERGLQMVKDGHGGSGLEAATLQRARKIMARENLTRSHIKRIKQFGDRHIPQGRKEVGYTRGDPGYPSPRRTSVEVWGGEAGWRWATRKTEEFERNESSGSSTSNTVLSESDINMPEVDVRNDIMEPSGLKLTDTKDTAMSDGSQEETLEIANSGESENAVCQPCQATELRTEESEKLELGLEPDVDVRQMGAMAQSNVLAGQEPHFRGIAVLEGPPTGDRRRIEKGALGFRQMPVPLMYLPANLGGGHNGSVVAGVWTRMWREEYDGFNAIWGEGIFADTPEGREAKQMLDTGMMRGISTDLDSVEAGIEMNSDDPDDYSLQITSARIMANTFLGTPAFEEAAIWTVHSADKEEAVVASGGTILRPEMTVVTELQFIEAYQGENS